MSKVRYPEPLKYGNYLFPGRRTFKKFHQYQPDASQIKDAIEKDIGQVPLNELSKRLNTDPEKGLNEDQIIKRRERDGLNRISRPKYPHNWLIATCKIKFMLIFVSAGVALCLTTAFVPSLQPIGSFALDNMYIGLVLVIVMVFNICVSYYVESQCTKVMKSFRGYYPEFSTVIRNGQRKRLHNDDIVTGDLIMFKAGDIVPADLRITEAWSLLVDDSPLTDKKEPVRKNTVSTSDDPLETENLLLCGTRCLEGCGKGLVVATGDRTALARMFKRATAFQRMETRLSSEVRMFVRKVGWTAVNIGSILFIVSCFVGYNWLDAMILIIVLVTASIPEVLIFCITSCLTLTARKLISKNCLVKDLEAIETLGATSIICCDKTGVVTQGRMTVVNLWLDSKLVKVDTSDGQSGLQLVVKPHDDTWWAFMRAASLCSETESKLRRMRSVIKRLCSCDQSEVAIMEFISATSDSVQYIREQHLKVFEIPFNPHNKYHVTIHDVGHKSPEHGCSYLMCMKGAAETVMKFCSTILVDGQDQPITGSIRHSFQTISDKLMNYGERIIGFCDYEFPQDKFPHAHKFLEEDIPLSGLRFLGFLAMLDPPRASVPDAVLKCRQAGIKVVLLTGDHKMTAKAVARQVGIISVKNETRDELAQRLKISVKEIIPGGASAIVMHSNELDDTTSEDLCRILTSYQEVVFVRITPEQKTRIVNCFHKLGERVAVTGDSVGDVEAMHQADTGIGLSLSSCDVSNQAADVILMNDDFASIVDGIEEGRLIYDNLQKSITYVLACNLPEFAPFIFVLLLKIPFPLGTMFILFIDLGMNMLPTLSLVYEKPESDIMKNFPPLESGKGKLICNKILHKSYLQLGVIETLAGFYTYFIIMAQHGFLPSRIIGIRDAWYAKTINDLTDSFNQEWTYTARKTLEHTCQTAFLITIIIMQCFSLIICRTRKEALWEHGLRNHVMNVTLCLETVLAAIFVYIPGTTTAFHLVPLKVVWWLPGLPFGILALAFNELRKYLMRHLQLNSWLESQIY